ncbi:nitric oxide-associated protein 1 [Zophobas morio]|uniref:nitric oxide-associated protein 1 n=1 Tax=Zophobas morio TaxID=2755281 RepID=UPI003083C2F3
MFSLLKLHNLKSRIVGPLRQCSQFKTKLYMKTAHLESKKPLDELIKKFALRLIYNTIVERKVLRSEQLQKNKSFKKVQLQEPVPVTLKYLNDDIHIKEDTPATTSESYESEVVNFPYNSSGHNVETSHEINESQSDPYSPDVATALSEEVQKRYELHQEMKNWMLSYDNYDDSCLGSEGELDINESGVYYGTPDPKSKISNVPCGGCGALLHCRDTAIPGYIPSEIFKNSVAYGGSNLEAIVCQRCHFLKHYNVALQVQVTPEDYPKVLSTIGERRGLVILLVDLLDFPCSIWPGIGEIFGSRTPIIIVGNKVDLLAQDSKDFFKHIRRTLLNSVKLQGFATFNIKDIVLISAKTGYGIEDLITKLNSLKRVNGDVYIVGCTNVGKSSLFNALLQSDYCKTQAMDLIQRATTSVWPGTTLNLLKFPIRRPEGYRQYLRHKRLEILEKIETEEQEFRKQQLKVTKNPKYASLIGHIDVTKNPYKNMKSNEEVKDMFTIRDNKYDKGVTKMGINEKSPEFIHSKWCYDTPGVVQPDQIIHLLTTDELLLTLPKQVILPRTFCVKPNSTLFIGGLSRLDYVNGSSSVRLSVFASNELPITICDTGDAEELYEELLGTDLLKVPTGGADRLAKWPKLEMAKEFTITGINWQRSANDIVLSSSGWVALTGKESLQYNFRAWTPEKRGVYLRDCLLPHAVALTGRRVKNSVAYNKYKFFLQ